MNTPISPKQVLLLVMTLMLALSLNLRGNCDQCKKVLDEFNKLVHEYVNISKELRAQIKANIENSDKIRKLHGE